MVIGGRRLLGDGREEVEEVLTLTYRTDEVKEADDDTSTIPLL
jgi:hypothetical protein